jgi:hypothetical protein
MRNDPLSENGKLTTPAPTSGTQRSKRLRNIVCASGIGAAGVGLLYVLTGNARAIDIVLIAGGVLVTLAGLALVGRRNSRT